MSILKVTVQIEGPESEPDDRGYTKRETLATFHTTAVDADAWKVYRDAVDFLTPEPNDE